MTAAARTYRAERFSDSLRQGMTRETTLALGRSSGCGMADKISTVLMSLGNNLDP
ncbi:hypothetical protein F0726_01899 [Acidithiobacillus caldus]|nr:hypothetical protein F0726_01899 [Acidithiobacillus caldus]